MKAEPVVREARSNREIFIIIFTFDYVFDLVIIVVKFGKCGAAIDDNRLWIKLNSTDCGYFIRLPSRRRSIST